MFLDGLASTLGWPRSSLTVPLPRARVVFYSGNNRTSDRIFQSSPMFLSSRPSVCLMIFIAVTTGNGRLAREFPVSVSRTRARRKPNSQPCGKKEKGSRNGIGVQGCLMPQKTTVCRGHFSARWRREHQCAKTAR